MTHLVQYTAAGESRELVLPDAVTVKIDAGHTDGVYELFEVNAPRGPTTPLHRTGWGKAYYVLNGRMIVRVEDEGFDLGPGSVLSPTVKYLAVGLTGAWGRFFADLDATVPHGRPIEEVAEQLQQVLARHDVTLAGLETASLEPVS
jgi:hypothetical protein